MNKIIYILKENIYFYFKNDQLKTKENCLLPQSMEIVTVVLSKH